jgi:hypothetical protein
MNRRELEELVRDEVARQLGDEQTSRTGQHVDPSGEVSYDFEGRVFAEGLDLPMGIAPWADDTSNIAWLFGDPELRDVQAFLRAYHQPGGGGGYKHLTIRAVSADGTVEAGLDAQANNSFGPVGVWAYMMGGSWTIIDDIERSDFLQLASTARLRLAHGTVALNWPGGTAYSNQAGILHGLGASPAAFWVAGRGLTAPGGFQAFPFHYAAGAGPNFQVNVQAYSVNGNPAAGAALTVEWVALG